MCLVENLLGIGDSTVCSFSQVFDELPQRSFHALKQKLDRTTIVLVDYKDQLNFLYVFFFSTKTVLFPSHLDDDSRW